MMVMNGDQQQQQQQLTPNRASNVSFDEQFEKLTAADEPYSDTFPNIPQLQHWSEVVFECADIKIDEANIAGGSDYGQLPYFIQSGDILLTVDGIKVSGLTRADLIEIIRKCPEHAIKAVSSSTSFGLPIDLREYLSRRFMRGSVDHDLQATIRDNVYARTIPCTTRPPREGEADGVDYKFVSREVFLEMEKSRVLLESGVYAGYYYGTPLPLSRPIPPAVEQPQQPQQPHPSMSMAAKRKRNRSNIAAIDASSLPHGWEKISDTHYGVYYIDHINKRTQYERPYELELIKGANGFGFTLIEVDKSLVVVKNLIPGGPAYQSGIIQPGDFLVSVSGISVSSLQHSDIARLFATFSVGDRVKITFARGYQLPPSVLCSSEDEFEYINVLLTKGVNGFGFTISDGNVGQKVKKILDVDRCGFLRQGDILVSVNDIDLNVLTHLDVVDVLKKCSIGDPTNVTIKRKKRFRSKTPINLHSATDAYYEKESNIPQRNCKTPNCELMMRGADMEWSTIPADKKGSLDDINVTLSQPPADGELKAADTVAYGNMSFDPHANHHQQQPSPASQVPPNVVANNGNNSGVNEEEEYEYYRVSLNKNESGFGFRIVGGAEENRSVSIGSIVIGGVAHRDGILKAGDEIISIGEVNVMGAPHRQAVELMSSCGATVSLLVRRKKDSDVFDVVLHREAHEGFGFVIISCGNCALIGRIIDGSPAHLCQRLRIRDRIVAVNGVDISKMGHPDIVNMIKESSTSLRLRIMPADCFSVELVRGPKGFGFSIRGGAEFNGMPLFILRIATEGPAFSLLSIGDEIIEINGISTVGMTHAEAVALISQSGMQVKLKLRKNASLPSVPDSNDDWNTYANTGAISMQPSHQQQQPPQQQQHMYSNQPPQSVPFNPVEDVYGYQYSYSAPNLMRPHPGHQPQQQPSGHHHSMKFTNGATFSN